MMFGMLASPERYVIGPFVATPPNKGRSEVQQKELISPLFNNPVRDGVLDEMTGIKPPRSSSASEGKIANSTPDPKVAHSPKSACSNCRGVCDPKNRLPADSEYVQHEIQEMADQLDHERRLTGDATFKTLLKEMWTIPGNRNRAVISVLLMIFQQMTGVNAIVSLTPLPAGSSMQGKRIAVICRRLCCVAAERNYWLIHKQRDV